MSAPLSAIPPLIPLPSQPSSSSSTSTPQQPTDVQQDFDVLDDKFATLFQPPTPRASRAPSPTQAPIFPPPQQPTDDRPPASPSRPRSHARTPSLADDFGAFVSVSADADPLGGPSEFTPIEAPHSPAFGQELEVAPRQPGAPPLSTTSLAFFETFGAEARVKDAQNRKGVLDELLAHEDDPLYFINSEAQPSPGGGLAAVDEVEERKETLIEEEEVRSIPSLLEEAIGGDSPQSRLSHITPDPSPAPSFLDILLGPADPPPRRAPAKRSTHPSTPLPPLTTSPSADTDTPSSGPPSPKLARSGSSSRWLPAILSRPSASTAPTTASRTTLTPTPESSRRTPSPNARGHVREDSAPIPVSAATSALSSAANTLSRSFTSGWGSLPRQSSHPASLPSYFSSPAASSSAPVHAQTGVAPASNPFASHAFVPPTGAPGFAGDRAWAPSSAGNGAALDAKEALGAGWEHLKLVGRKEMTEVVVKQAVADALRPHLPALPRLAQTWTLLYSLDQHGISLSTLYNLSARPLTKSALAPPPSFLAIQDASGGVFGVFCGEGVQRRDGGYYGGGESFLWRVATDGRVEVWKWTGRNEYVALCEADFLSFGGGDGHYGLFLDAALLDGSSARCPTFDNPPLCAGVSKAGSVPFECVGLEVWGVGP